VEDGRLASARAPTRPRSIPTAERARAECPFMSWRKALVHAGTRNIAPRRPRSSRAGWQRAHRHFQSATLACLRAAPITNTRIPAHLGLYSACSCRAVRSKGTRKSRGPRRGGALFSRGGVELERITCWLVTLARMNRTAKQISRAAPRRRASVRNLAKHI
jgi:hypothetical protein